MNQINALINMRARFYCDLQLNITSILGWVHFNTIIHKLVYKSSFIYQFACMSISVQKQTKVKFELDYPGDFGMSP